ncbi:unnamed protein product [Spirodela intermedia]|uniref:Uncharacterized protein n=1 Tax=Spirodela intermedia TaxID=51605 RepID=A0A7I8JUN8_SPIIN|nr:unnamed protein product [Spirodela intermedia]CAA6673172.1 unnamed protein product [Spirodela intermedia]
MARVVVARTVTLVSRSPQSRKSRRSRPGGRKQAALREKELELVVNVCIEEELPDDPEVLSIAEMLRLNVAMAMKVAFGLLDSDYKTRDTSIDDLGRFEKIEASVLLCNDDFIQKLNKEWRDEDKATDVLSMSQHIPELDLPILMLGDLVISVETAARQAEERGHTLLDEIRILVVHGLLHLLGFDHEISDEAEKEMEKEEELILKNLGWRGKGLIKSASDGLTDEFPKVESPNDVLVENMKKNGSLRPSKPKFRYIFCDMDGTLLNSKSQISSSNVEALKEASSRGVNIIIATGKTRPAVINVLKKVNLAGNNGISSESTPGIFLQVFLVCLYSTVAFSQDRCFTPFNDPLVESLHSVYHEPRAEVVTSIDHLLSISDCCGNQLISSSILEAIATAGVTPCYFYMLEIVPPQTSKGTGVKMLLDHLNINAEEEFNPHKHGNRSGKVNK